MSNDKDPLDDTYEHFLHFGHWRLFGICILSFGIYLLFGAWYLGFFKGG